MTKLCFSPFYCILQYAFWNWHQTKPTSPITHIHRRYSESHEHTLIIRRSSEALLLPVHCWQTGSHHGAPAPQPSGCQDDAVVSLHLCTAVTSHEVPLFALAFSHLSLHTRLKCYHWHPPTSAGSLPLFEPSSATLRSHISGFFFHSSLPLPAWLATLLTFYSNVKGL